jgi:hypothetical protein
MRIRPSVMKIINADKGFMAKRPESLPPGWWIVDLESNSFFDGPYRSRKAALERYKRLPASLRNPSPLTAEIP